MIIAVCASSCGNHPDTYLFDDSSRQPSTDDTDSATTPETDTDNSDTQRGDTISFDTEPPDTGLVDTTPGGTGNVDTAPGDTGYQDPGPVDSDPKDSATNVSSMSRCEAAAMREPKIVCCPGPMNMGVCDETSLQYCCTADLTEAISCRIGESPGEETCRFSCGLDRDKSKCVDNSCRSPFVVDTRSGASWTKQGDWSDYKNSFRPDDMSCGDGSGDEDVWFSVLVPAGKTALFTEVGTTDCTVRLVQDCHKKTCLSYSEYPEQIYLQNKGAEATFFNVVLSQATDITNPSWKVVVLPLWASDSQ